ncbi:MAG: DUF4922 domain-containing protein [Cyanobacteria bacterium P01_A01_bin.84]
MFRKSPEYVVENKERQLLESGTLYKKVIQTTQHALECGALVSIPTDFEFVESGGVYFLVRILTNLIRKDKAKKKQDKDFNPFLPYEKDLFVENISDTHVCILNKYNVVENHLLIVTRAFEEQESLLTLEDFSAMSVGLSQIDGLVFYNGGKVAGASQRHKHLQLVPLPLTSHGEQIPIESLFTNNSELQVNPEVNPEFNLTFNQIPGLPFLHSFLELETNWVNSPLKVWEYYCQILEGFNLVNGKNTADAYNLLVTRKWMLIVPRKAEKFQGISVNSLGFAGCLLVRNQEEMKILKDFGAINVLQSIAFER